MNNREIGKILSVGVHGIIAEVSNNLGNYVNTKDGLFFVGEVGSYVSIYEIGRTIIAEIVSVEEKTQSTFNTKFAKPISKREVNLNLIGEIIENKFYLGVSKMPLIFSSIYMISKKELMAMLEVGREEEIVCQESSNTRSLLVSIGHSVVFPEYEVKLNIDRFFGFHFAVFGNTGAGKSNTVARVIQNIFKKRKYSAKGAKFVIIDSNGEYDQSFSLLNELNPQIKYETLSCEEGSEMFEIPVWALSVDDWATLLHASEKTQLPVLSRAIDIARLFYSERDDDDELKNHILASTFLGILQSSDSTPSKSDKIIAIATQFKTNKLFLDTDIMGSTLRELLEVQFGEMKGQEKLIEGLKKYIKPDVMKNTTSQMMIPYTLEEFCQAVEFATLYEGSVSSQRIQEYTSTLMTRLKSLREGDQGRVLSRTKYNNLDDYIDSLLGNNQIMNLDISSLDDSSAEVVTKVLAKLLLDYLKRKDIKAETPINFVIEEAHRFVKNEVNYGAIGYNIFERIAKEGRKFGMLLGISSQRPSELSKTVVSQCSNFIIHRVQNPDDLNYISKMVPYINQNIIDRLTYLRTGNALVFGTAINLPTLTKFDRADPPTDSGNARISEKWYIE